MFKFFKKKSELEKLQDEYKKMLKEAYQLSQTDRKKGDAKQAEAEELWKRIEKLKLVENKS